MKKQKISKVDVEFNPSVFGTSGELPTPETVNKAVENLTVKSPKTVETTEKNLKKRETKKGTIIFTVMIDKDVASQAKIKSFQDNVTFSEVITQALKEYLSK